MKTWTVTIPVGGHAVLSVEAETEQEAIDKAVDSVQLSDLESWDILNPVSRGNVLSFPSPWEIEAEED